MNLPLVALEKAKDFTIGAKKQLIFITTCGKRYLLYI
jgi:hypothetical protein